MLDPLHALDLASRETARTFIDASLRLSAEGVQVLLAEGCVFEGALSAGALRGRAVVEAHLRQVFKRVAAKGAPRLRGLAVSGQEVVADWEIQDPDHAAFDPVPGRYTLRLDEAGLISAIKTEWDPMAIRGPKG